MLKAVFLDRDGVINENRADHVKSWAEFQFLPGARDAVSRLSRAGVPVFVISNQAIINRGVVAEATVDAINRQMMTEIELSGGRIEAIACCPHRPDESCSCRKPRPGLLLSLAETHGVNFQESVVIGDALTDIEAAHAVGGQGVLVLTGRGRDQWAQAEVEGRRGFMVANDLSAAIDVLLQPVDAVVDILSY